MIELLVKALAAYLLGGVMGGDVLRALLGGDDLRRAGSGNVGATNALRTRGKGFALGVLAIDVGKGVLATTALPALPWPWPFSAAPALPLACACGVAVALGHCYPLFQRFRGGKGVATLAGVFAAVLPLALPWILAAFVVTLLLSGYVSLSSVLAALTALAWVVAAGQAKTVIGAFTLAMAALLLFKHRDNLWRLAQRREPRFERVRLLGRVVDRWRGR